MRGVPWPAGFRVAIRRGTFYNKVFMPNYRIYRMKESPRQHFRWAPHVSGAANVKRRDYDEAGQIEAANEYAAWDMMRSSERPLDVGDLLETDSGDLRICKYIGFEAAAWALPPADLAGAPDGSLTTASVTSEVTPTAAPAESPIGYTATDRPAGE
jgi:hypothetical protein